MVTIKNNLELKNKQLFLLGYYGTNFYLKMCLQFVSQLTEYSLFHVMLVEKLSRLSALEYMYEECD